MRRTLGLAFAVILGFAGMAQAAPLDLKDVSAEAKWAAHLDCDALVASSIAKKAHEQFVKEHPGAEGHLAMVRSLWNFDPTKDIHSVTIYGRQIKRETGVAIVRAKVDQNRLLEKAKLAPDHRVVTYGKYELHSWTHDKGSKHERTLTGAFYKPDVILFSVASDEVMAAIDVLDGVKPSFASKNPSLAGQIPAGSILVAGVTGLSGVDLPCKSPLAKQADSVVLAIGETQGEVFVAGQLTVKTTEVAEQMKTVLDGGLALASLLHGDDAEAIKLIGAVKVSAAGKVVTVEGRASADSVWAAAQKAIAKAKSMHKHCGFGGPAGHCPPGRK
jgi:hypothetical protein